MAEGDLGRSSYALNHVVDHCVPGHSTQSANHVIGHSVPGHSTRSTSHTVAIAGVSDLCSSGNGGIVGVGGVDRLGIGGGDGLIVGSGDGVVGIVDLVGADEEGVGWVVAATV